MWLSNEQQALIAKYRGTNPPSRKHLTRIPERDRRYKCPVCHLVLSSSDLQDGACPVCGERAWSPEWNPEALAEAARRQGAA